MGTLRAAGAAPVALRALAASVHNACLALGSNQELVLCLKDLQARILSSLQVPVWWLSPDDCLQRHVDLQ